MFLKSPPFAPLRPPLFQDIINSYSITDKSLCETTTHFFPSFFDIFSMTGKCVIFSRFSRFSRKRGKTNSFWCLWLQSIQRDRFQTSLQTKNVFVVFGDQPLVPSTVLGNKEIFTQQQHGKKTQLKFISSTATFFLKIFHPVDVGNHRVDPLSLKV